MAQPFVFSTQFCDFVIVPFEHVVGHALALRKQILIVFHIVSSKILDLSSLTTSIIGL